MSVDMEWQTIDTAPKGQYVDNKFMRDGKEVTMSNFIAPQVLLLLKDQIYLTRALPCGRWNGMSEKDKPSHWCGIPKLPAMESDNT